MADYSFSYSEEKMLYVPLSFIPEPGAPEVSNGPQANVTIVNYGENTKVVPSIVFWYGYTYDNINAQIKIYYKDNKFQTTYIQKYDSGLLPYSNFLYDLEIPEFDMNEGVSEYTIKVEFYGEDEDESGTVIEEITCYREAYYDVTFNLKGGTLVDGTLSTQVIKIGEDAIPPTAIKEGAEFIGWDKPYTNITADTEINALWYAETQKIYIVGNNIYAKSFQEDSSLNTIKIDKYGNVYANFFGRQQPEIRILPGGYLFANQLIEGLPPL